MKMTNSINAANSTREWFVVDATDLPLGRLASEVAFRLRGKHKSTFTPNADGGDNIVIINAEKVRVTGRKYVQMTHHWHTGHPGGIKSKTVEDEMRGNFPQRVVERAVLRMMPKTKLGRHAYGKLFVYAGSEHPHTAQKPADLNVGELIAKTNR